MGRLRIMLRRAPIPGVTHPIPLMTVPKQQRGDNDSEQEEMDPGVPLEHEAYGPKAKAPPAVGLQIQAARLQ